MIEPLRRSLRVACAPAHAFATWTTRASAWWPPAHTMSGERGVEIIFEPKVGGRIFERTADGREFDWGEITVWEPPGRLGYRWSIATTPEHATDVEIRFQGEGELATRVEIEHRGRERLGEQGPSWRDVNQGGWDVTLPAYAGACLAAGSLWGRASTALDDAAWLSWRSMASIEWSDPFLAAVRPTQSVWIGCCS